MVNPTRLLLGSPQPALTRLLAIGIIRVKMRLLKSVISKLLAKMAIAPLC